jgi:hypothetical protein
MLRHARGFTLANKGTDTRTEGTTRRIITGLIAGQPVQCHCSRTPFPSNRKVLFGAIVDGLNGSSFHSRRAQ